MKQKLILAVAILLSVTSIIVVNASPGAANDPLVSRSYVDRRINEIMTFIGESSQDLHTNQLTESDLQDAVNSAVEAAIDAAIDAAVNSALATTVGIAVNAALEATANNANFIPVRATQGNILIGHEGSEIILRAGTAIGHVLDQNGMVNATTGQEILNGTTININNLIVVPREGRGVTVTSEEAWFMVRGGYTILN